MTEQNSVLISKIKIASESGEPAYFKKKVGFYENYSRFVLKALSKYSFQEFLYGMLSTENIEEKTVNAVVIKVYPVARKNGFNIVGKCNTLSGKIRIYPKTSNFCDAFSKKFGKNILISYVGNRARAALIHELLHLKYESDEQKVRELTELYFCVYMKKRLVKNSAIMQGLIFNSQKPSLYQSK
jgi:hypothetical protein